MKKILNVLLGVLMAITVVLLVYAIATGGSEAAISVNLMWGYFLLVFAVAAAIFCAVFGMIQNPAGIKGTHPVAGVDHRNRGRVVFHLGRPHGEHRRSPEQRVLRPH